MSGQERVASIDLIVSDLEAASDFIEAITKPAGKERVPGFSCYSFAGFDVMLSESALIETGKASGVIIHVEVADVEAKAADILARSGLSPAFGPSKTDWGTYSAIYRNDDLGFAIDIFSNAAQ
ncbi:MAG: hypothetical protein Q4C71_02960 [Microbacteriaceae bacterium]|nr:hypothetical protein [Microbacteriaceae bacterium]